MAGKLYFYHGCMNSGKSARIIMDVFSLREKDELVYVLKKNIDTRSIGTIKSRAVKTEVECTQFGNTTELGRVLQNIEEDAIAKYYLGNESNTIYIYIDEAQFLSSTEVNNIFNFLHKESDIEKRIICYGLKNDFLGHLFKGSKSLMELSDTIREINSQCDCCPKKATMHLLRRDGKIVKNAKDTIKIGDKDEYLSVCPSCFNKKYHHGE